MDEFPPREEHTYTDVLLRRFWFSMLHALNAGLGQDLPMSLVTYSSLYRAFITHTKGRGEECVGFVEKFLPKKTSGFENPVWVGRGVENRNTPTILRAKGREGGRASFGWSRESALIALARGEG